MYLKIFLADFAVFRVFLGISRDFAEIPEFRGSATARNIRSPDHTMHTPFHCSHTLVVNIIVLKNACVLQVKIQANICLPTVR